MWAFLYSELPKGQPSTLPCYSGDGEAKRYYGNLIESYIEVHQRDFTSRVLLCGYEEFGSKTQ